MCFLRSGRLQFAKTHLEKAIEVHPRNAVILKSLGEVSGFLWIFSLANGDARLLWDPVYPGSIKSPERRFEQMDLLDMRSCPFCDKKYTPILTRIRATPGL